jgi:PAS domain S-box-containing protein
MFTQKRAHIPSDAFLLQLADALRPLADPVVIQETAVRVLGEHLGSDRAYYVEVDQERREYVVEREWRRVSVDSHASRYPVDQWPMPWPGDGEAWVVRDVDDEPAISGDQRASFRGHDIGACIVLPLVKGGQLVAALAADSRQPRDWTDGDVGLLVETAERTWAAVERARAEAALRAREERYLALYNSIDQCFCTIELAFDSSGSATDYRFLEISPSFARHTGIDDASGRWIREIVPDHDEHWFEIYGQVARTREPSRFEHYSTPIGRWWSVYAFPIEAPELRRVGVLFSDITDRKNADDELRESEERLRVVIESVQDYAIFTLDPNGLITSWNDGARRLKGYTAEEILGRPVSTFYLPEETDKAAREMQLALATGRSEDESWRVRKDGSRFWVNEIMTPLRSADGRHLGFTKISRDLTERKAFEDALQRAHDQLEQRVAERTADLARANAMLQQEVSERRAVEAQIKMLFERLISIQEEERRRIAREIHDHLGQQLTALRINLEVAYTRLDGDPQELAQWQRTAQLADDLDRSIDFLTWELRPAALDQLGLSAALQNLVSGWSERFDIPADFDLSGDPELRLPPDAEANLYRIVQESLHNVVKHADATNVRVHLDCLDHETSIVVEDNGCGFDARHTVDDGHHLGLVSMRERAALSGGRLDIESTPAGGTIVTVRVPRVAPPERPRYVQTFDTGPASPMH